MHDEKSGPELLLSACLVGVRTMWNGETNPVDELVAWVRAGRAVFLCPEQVGGLTTPREPAEIEPGKSAADVLAGNARVLSITGADFTQQFVRGAREALALCQALGIQTAILAAGSPSCGSQQTYDGTHSEMLRPGRGVTAELLAQNGITVCNQINYREYL